MSGKVSGKVRGKKPEGNDVTDIKVRRGRPAGATNYSEADTWALLDIISKEKPIGELGWNRVESAYNQYACQHGRPLHTSVVLTNKFKMVSFFTEWTGILLTAFSF